MEKMGERGDERKLTHLTDLCAHVLLSRVFIDLLNHMSKEARPTLDSTLNLLKLSTL